MKKKLVDANENHFFKNEIAFTFHSDKPRTGRPIIILSYDYTREHTTIFPHSCDTRTHIYTQTHRKRERERDGVRKKERICVKKKKKKLHCVFVCFENGFRVDTTSVRVICNCNFRHYSILLCAESLIKCEKREKKQTIHSGGEICKSHISICLHFLGSFVFFVLARVFNYKNFSRSRFLSLFLSRLLAALLYFVHATNIHL